MPSAPETLGANTRQYRRGALLGMTMAEAFILIAFALLLLLAAWKTQADKEAESYRELSSLSPPEVVAVADMAQVQRLVPAADIVRSDGFEALHEMVKNGEDVARLAEIATDSERWRFIDKDELRRILDGAQELPDNLQRDLMDLVEVNEPSRIMQLLEMTKRAPDNAEMRARLAGIGARLDAARAAEQSLIDDLDATLGKIVREVGGHIDENGSIVLPDSILFDVGSARVTPRMRAFLEQICTPWLDVMMRSPVTVSGAKIEGHASSEWRAGSSVQEAYLNNLDLSQRRSAAVLHECLDIVAEGEVENWARGHLVAVGYSSARPALTEDGAEDFVKSRRVVFSLETDKSGLLNDLEDEVDDSLSGAEM